ncbi:MAG TPA: APC family permease [Thermoanaerobaculia bacterium]|nr:APC family permease [Thermoanaerobaculia bacterium]
MELRRVLGFRDLVFFYTLTCFSLRWIATAAEAGPSSLVVWVLAALGLFVPLAASVLELSSRYPEEGGLYVWTRRAFGDFPGFLAGFLYWASNLPFFPALLYFTAANALFLGGARGAALQDNRGFFLAFSLFGLMLACAANIRGLRYGTWLHNAAAVATWIPAILLVVCGGLVFARFGPATSFSAAQLVPSAGLKDALFFSTIAFAFGGIETASFLGDEIRDPRRNLPRALLVAGALITLAYLAGTASLLVALPASEASGLTGITKAIAAASAKAGLPAMGPSAALLITLAGVGVTGAWLATSARLPFVGGLDRFLPPAFAKVHPKWGTPAVAILTQSALSAVFVLLSQAGTGVKGAYDALVAMSVISYFVPFLFLFASAIRLSKGPLPEGAIRVPGGRSVSVALATLGFLTTAVSLLLAFVPPDDEPNKAFAVAKLAGLSVLLLAGALAAYAAAARRRRKAPA